MTDTEKRSEKPQASKPVPVRHKGNGFRAVIPAKDWNAYTDEQRAEYDVLTDK